MYSPIRRKNRDEAVIYKVIHMTASKRAHRGRYLLPRFQNVMFKESKLQRVSAQIEQRRLLYD